MGHVLPDRLFWARRTTATATKTTNPTNRRLDLPMTPDTDRNLQLPTTPARSSPAASTRPYAPSRPSAARRAFVNGAQGRLLLGRQRQAYIDYIGSWGPMILGHGHPAVLEGGAKAAVDGFSFGAPTERESNWPRNPRARAQHGHGAPGELGTEAGMSAIRLARGATGAARSSSSKAATTAMPTPLLVKAGSGLATFGNAHQRRRVQRGGAAHPGAGIQQRRQLEEAFALHGSRTACLIIEPIAGNMNFVRASGTLHEALPRAARNTAPCWSWTKS